MSLKKFYGHLCFFLLILYMFFIYMPLELVKDPGSAVISHGRRTVLLGNHRNFTDFFLHDAITESVANVLSRALVGVVFFPFAITTYFENTVWFFVRGRAREDPEQCPLPRFDKWIDDKFTCPRNTRNSIIVYPEGHRNLGPDPLQLRTGMLKYAYSRHLPVQIFIGHGYDSMLNQRFLTADWKRSTKVYYSIDSIIESSAWETWEGFKEEVSKRFIALFYKVREQARLGLQE